MLNTLINYRYNKIDEDLKNFLDIICKKIGNVKQKISNFNGPQNQGSDTYWMCIYNSLHNSQSDGLQLFIEIKNGIISYGVYRFFDKTYLVGPFQFDGDLKKLYSFIENNSDYIVNDTKKSIDYFKEEISEIFKNNNNISMTVEEISKKLKYSPGNAELIRLLSNDVEFESIDDRWKLSSYIPNDMIEDFNKAGFVLKSELDEKINNLMKIIYKQNDDILKLKEIVGIKDEKIDIPDQDIKSSDEQSQILKNKINRKKSEWSNLKITVDSVDLSGESARQSFVNFINKVIEKITPEKFHEDYKSFFRKKKKRRLFSL